MAGVGGGVDDGDGGEEGEEIRGDEKEGFEFEEGERVGARLLPDVAGLEARGGEEGNGFEVEDVGLEGE